MEIGFSNEIIYEQNINSKQDLAINYATVDKDSLFLNRRKIQKIEYIK